MATEHHVEGTQQTDWREYGELSLTPILGAALEFFQEKGYHGATVRAIANRAGLTMPALYYHHGNKEGILMALLDIAMDDLLAHVEGGLVEAGDDSRKQFANFVTAVVLHTTHRRDLASLHPEYRFLGDECRGSYETKRARVYGQLVDVLDRGAEGGVFQPQDSRFTARAVLGMLLAITDWYRDGGPSTPDEIAQAYVGRTLNLVGASEGATLPSPPPRRARARP